MKTHFAKGNLTKPSNQQLKLNTIPKSSKQKSINFTLKGQNCMMGNFIKNKIN